jgi:DNA-binding response OmpR family regulator
MGTLFSSNDSAAIPAIAKAIAHEVVRELTAAKELHVLVDTRAVDAVITVGPILVNVERYEASVRDRTMKLKLRKFALLAALMRNAGKALTRERLLQLAWGEEALEVDSLPTINVHVRRLRTHLGDESGLLQTISGVGYKLTDR